MSSGAMLRKFERLIGRTDSGIPLRDFSANSVKQPNEVEGHFSYNHEEMTETFTYLDGRTITTLKDGTRVQNFSEYKLG
jgi:hypothetical protein